MKWLSRKQSKALHHSNLEATPYGALDVTEKSPPSVEQLCSMVQESIVEDLSWDIMQAALER